MAFFKFRKNGAEQSGPTPAPESLEVLRKRARHRLIGAAALVLLGVVGFPMLFDSQPRPVAVDIAIDIPDKAKVAPLSAAPASAAPASDTPPAVEPTPHASSAVAPVTAKVAPVAPPAASAPAAAKVEPKPEAKAEPKPESKATPKADSKADSKAAVKPDEKTATSGKAQALLDGKDPAKAAAAAPRYAVQVGAFADPKKAQEARAKLEKAGIKTYTQVVTTADGKRTRVRVGPWESKSEADKTAEKIKKLNLSAAVLTL
jgi:DedD protein